MDWNAILAIALPAVFVVVGIALIWFLIELIATVRSTRKTVTSIKNEIEPTLAHAESITAQIDPLIAKVEPLVDRVSLTVDAANLEVMRLDQILENVTDITEGLSSATSAIDAATNAPVNLVNKTSEKVRNVFKAHKASPASAALGAGKAKTEHEKEDALPQHEQIDALPQSKKTDNASSAEHESAVAANDSGEGASGEDTSVEVASGKESFDFLDNMLFTLKEDAEHADANSALENEAPTHDAFTEENVEAFDVAQLEEDIKAEEKASEQAKETCDASLNRKGYFTY